MNLVEWLTYHTKHAYRKCTWMGVKAVKNPLDAWIYQEIIYKIKPDIIIEIGSLHGGDTLYLAHLLEMIGKGKVISIDIDRSAYFAKHHRIVEITGDSSSTEVVSQVSRLCQDKSVLIIHDGSHEKEQVLKDLQAYAKFVSLNSYFIVEDGLIDLHNPGKGPLAAIEEFLKKNKDFVVDSEQERYILTYNQKGFLKRIRK